MTAADQDRRLRLSALEFDVLTEHLGLERMPLVLKVPSPGRTRAERAELVDAVWRSLADRDLGGPTRLDPELEGMLRLLVRPDREVDARLWLDRSVRVLAAAGPVDDAVLVVKDEDELTFRPAAASGLAREAVSVLPAGSGGSVSVPSADLDAAAEEAGDDLERLPTALVRRGVRADDAETLARMVNGVGSRGQFGVAARDRWGRRTRAGHVVGCFDTPHGRYAQLRRESPSGQPWSTIAPADARRLTAHVEELLAEVTDGLPGPTPFT
ncbi:ESX secretion-associated protein EspG [Saccharopolyspora rosea]|uniref:ESX secretion-associated protein EspG n=1 Tax=Saccharopolyspora rosea TaxID=524884 RepID=A0ABW3FPJ7_9PSEU